MSGGTSLDLSHISVGSPSSNVSTPTPSQHFAAAPAHSLPIPPANQTTPHNPSSPGSSASVITTANSHIPTTSLNQACDSHTALTSHPTPFSTPTPSHQSSNSTSSPAAASSSAISPASPAPTLTSLGTLTPLQQSGGSGGSSSGSGIGLWGGSGSTGGSASGSVTHLRESTLETLPDGNLNLFVLVFEHAPNGSGAYVKTVVPRKIIGSPASGGSGGGSAGSSGSVSTGGSTAPGSGSSSNDKYACLVGLEGQYDLLFVANASPELRKILRAPEPVGSTPGSTVTPGSTSPGGFTNVSPYLKDKIRKDVLRLVACQSPGSSTTGTGAPGGSPGGSTPGSSDYNYFLMTTLKESLSFSRERPLDLGTVGLRRLSCRLDVVSMIPGLKIEELSVHNRYSEAVLYRDGHTDMTGTTPGITPSAPFNTTHALLKGTATYTPVNGHITYTNENDPSKCLSSCTSSIYAYENPRSDQDNLELVLKGRYHGKEFNNESHPLVITNQKLERNRIYRLYLSMGSGSAHGGNGSATPGGSDGGGDGLTGNPKPVDSIKVTVGVTDWNDDAIQIDASDLEASLDRSTVASYRVTESSGGNPASPMNSANPSTIRLSNNSSSYFKLELRSRNISGLLSFAGSDGNPIMPAPDGNHIFSDGTTTLTNSDAHVGISLSSSTSPTSGEYTRGYKVTVRDNNTYDDKSYTLSVFNPLKKSSHRNITLIHPGRVLPPPDYKVIESSSSNSVSPMYSTNPGSLSISNHNSTSFKVEVKTYGTYGNLSCSSSGVSISTYSSNHNPSTDEHTRVYTVSVSANGSSSDNTYSFTVSNPYRYPYPSRSFSVRHPKKPRPSGGATGGPGILGRFAQYNVNHSANGFATSYSTSANDFVFSHSISANGYFTWDEAMHLFGSGITIDGHRYRLPTKEELKELAGMYKGNGYFGESKSLYIPLNGYYKPDSSFLQGVGSGAYGHYWSSTSANSGQAYYLRFDSHCADVDYWYGNDKVYRFPVRLILAD